MKNLFLIAGLVFFLSTCVDETAIIKQEPTFFDLKNYFKKQSEMLSQRTTVYKTTTVDSNRIEKIIDSLDFEKELKIFQESDINKVSWMDKYRVDSLFDTNGNLNRLIYKALDETMRTQELIISFEQNEVDTVRIFNDASGNVAKLQQRLTYIPSSGYSIESRQKTTLSDEHVLTVEVRFQK